MSSQTYASLYSITLYEPTTNQTEVSSVFLIKREYNKMLAKVNEIVYVDEQNKEWALKQIKEIKNE